MSLICIVVNTWKLKANWIQQIGFLLQNLLFAQHVSATIMPIIMMGSGSRNRTHNPQFHTRPTTCKPKRQVAQAATICITLELLMMDIMVPETC